jgi:hypothetical protein
MDVLHADELTDAPPARVVDNVQVMDYDLSESDLRDILSEAMQSMLGDADLELDADEEQGTKCCGRRTKGNGGKPAPHLNQEELDTAAKWLLERFGLDEDSDKDDDDSQEDEACASLCLLQLVTIDVP